MRGAAAASCTGVLCSAERVSAMNATSRIGATTMRPKRPEKPSPEAARMLHAPQEIETVLDLLDRADQGPQQKRDADAANESASDAVCEVHDLLGNAARARAERAEELLAESA